MASAFCRNSGSPCGLSLTTLAGVVARLELQIRGMNGSLALRDSAIRMLLRLLEMSLDHCNALDTSALLSGNELENLAALALVGTGDDDDFVAAFEMGFRHGRVSYSTSGASEMIFMKFLARSSRATGPKMRVPRGLPSAPMMTTALLSKRR